VSLVQSLGFDGFGLKIWAEVLSFGLEIKIFSLDWFNIETEKNFASRVYYGVIHDLHNIYTASYLLRLMTTVIQKVVIYY